MTEVVGSIYTGKAVDKTCIGYISKNVDFLGFHLDDQAAQEVALAEQTGLNHLDKLNRLCERVASETVARRNVRGYVRRVENDDHTQRGRDTAARQRSTDIGPVVNVGDGSWLNAMKQCTYG